MAELLKLSLCSNISANVLLVFVCELVLRGGGAKGNGGGEFFRWPVVPFFGGIFSGGFEGTGEIETSKS